MTTDTRNADAIIGRAVRVLRDGGLLLYPTDTVWGIGCDPFNATAVDRVFEVKRRSREKAFILLVDGMDMLSRYVPEIPEALLGEIDVPGKPLTAVYMRTTNLPAHILAEDGSVAIRIVQHREIRDLIGRFGLPVVSTSANTSGHPAPATFGEVETDIVKACDYALPAWLDTSVHKQPSPVVIVGSDGSLHRLR